MGAPEPAQCGPPSLGHTVSLPEGTRGRCPYASRSRSDFTGAMRSGGEVLPTRCPSHLAASAGVREKLKA